MHLLADYHAALGGLIHKHEGTLERFLGDGVLVIFTIPSHARTRLSARSAWRWRCALSWAK